MPHFVIQLLRVIHILGGAFWFGSLIFMTAFLLPTLKAIGPASGAVMQQLTEVRKFPLYMMFVPIITILSGLALFYNDSAGTAGAFMRSGPGMTFSTGAVLGIITAALGGSVNAPAGKRLGELGGIVRARGGPPTPEEQAEIARLQRRLTSATQAAAVLITLAAACMALARYM